MRHFDLVLHILTEAGFRDVQLDSATAAYYYYVLGAATAESAWVHAGRPLATVSPAELTELASAEGAQNPYIDGLVDRQSSSPDPHARFDAGLACVLAGLDAVSR